MLPFKGKYPQFHAHSYAFPGAVVMGDVRVHEYASIWPNVSIRGDVNYVEIGRYTNVQDNACLHVEDDRPCILGDYVTIGHNAIVHGSTLEDHVLVGMGAIILSRCHIGRGSIIAAGAVVKEGSIIPPYSLVVGLPARVAREDKTLFDRIHNQAIKYKTLWTQEYGLLPDADGEVWTPEMTIV